MPRKFSRFNKRRSLDDRQLKVFDKMYTDSANYSLDDIKERLGMAHAGIAALAKERHLQLRKPKHHE